MAVTNYLCLRKDSNFEVEFYYVGVIDVIKTANKAEVRDEGL